MITSPGQARAIPGVREALDQFGHRSAVGHQHVRATGLVMNDGLRIDTKFSIQRRDHISVGKRSVGNLSSFAIGSSQDQAT